MRSAPATATDADMTTFTGSPGPGPPSALWVGCPSLRGDELEAYHAPSQKKTRPRRGGPVGAADDAVAD
jgi:hypothetical protein